MRSSIDIGNVVKSRYEIEALLGSGGMSSVFRATDSMMCRNVAIKAMKKDDELPHQKPAPLSKHPLGIEYTILSRIVHRNLPSVFEVFIEGDFVFLVMELIEGRTLGTVIEAGLCTDFVDIFRIFYQVLGTLSFLNRRKIIYRDLKPSNILVVQNRYVKLVDFGAARRYSRFKKSDTVPLGTIGFASPEHYGYGQTDERSEVYTAGALLYYLVTRCNPADRPFRLDEPVQLNASVSPRLSDIITKATSMDRKRRFRNMRQLYLPLRDAAGEILGRERLIYCPVCWDILEVISAGEVEIDLCRGCGGIWCDSSELRLLEGMDRESLEPVSLNRPACADDGGRVSRSLICPVCSAPLLVRFHGKRSGVWLDSCPLGCGTWLDGGELIQIARHFMPAISSEKRSKPASGIDLLAAGASQCITAILRSITGSD